MQTYPEDFIQMKLNLELEKVVTMIKQENAKIVCIQLPDGLKPKSEEIQKEIEHQTNSKVVIWAGSCFGACDIPIGLEKLGVDIIIQFGHSEWKPLLKDYNNLK